MGLQQGLDFSQLKSVREVYERITNLLVHERHPYAGDLVFTAFSGSHQDAIKKGMDRMSEEEKWGVPYLTIDPKDIGRNYSKDIIRINSQSGKGGMAYILQTEFGLDIPEAMKQVVGNVLSHFADEKGAEIEPVEVYEAFKKEFVNKEAPLKSITTDFVRVSDEVVELKAVLDYKGETLTLEGEGNGPINALVHVIDQIEPKDFHLKDYRAHAISGGSDSDSAAYINLEHDNGLVYWGVGIDASIGKAGLKALMTAWNLMKSQEG